MGIVHREVCIANLLADELECLCSIVAVVDIVYPPLRSAEQVHGIPGIPFVNRRDPGVVARSVIIRVGGCWGGDDHFGAERQKYLAGIAEICYICLDNFGLVTVYRTYC